MTFEKYRILFKYLWNQVNYNVFELALTEAMNYELNPGYVKEKWNDFQNNQCAFVSNFKEFFDIMIRNIENENYKG